ncbi:MAG TPA: S24/S26 family peptidase [Candidatus Nanoarchaeia archaeon]|nr:S24/S26 family peptidase [Candidatus Nanoarchaeia archaeon]
MESNQFLAAIAILSLGILIGVVFSSLNQGISGFAVLDSKNLESLSSPQDYFNESSFLLYKDKLTIKVKNASITNYNDTNSMVPFITNYSNGIIVVPQSEKDISVGDIVSFSKGNLIVVHRIVDIEEDENGTYYITQGDNSNSKDTTMRFSDIKYKLVGILY